MTIAGPYFPLDELVRPGMLPFGELLDEVLEHIWIANPDYDATVGEGVIEVLIDRAVEVAVPGVPALTLALGNQPGGVNAELRARFAPTVSFTVELPLTLRVDASVLRPLKPGSDEPDPERKTLDITLGSIRVGYDIDGGFILDLPAGLTLQRCMIGTTGVILSATNVQWRNTAGFTGLHLDGATIELSGLPVDPGTIAMSDVSLGTGGFSGTVSWIADPPVWDGTEFHGLATGALCGFAGALTRVGLTFRQSALTGCDIRGDVFLPYLNRRIGLDLALDGRGGFSVAAGLPTSTPPEPSVTAGRAPGALLHIDLDLIEFDLDEVRFSAGGGGPATVSLTGRVQLDVAAISSPAFTFRRLTVDTSGRVALDGGWLDLDRARPADVHGFALEVTRVGFGAEPGGRMWVAINGGLKLAEGLPAGASVEGLKVSWDPRAADVLGSARVSLEGVGIDFEVPNAFAFAGSVALFQGDPEFGDGFTGHITLTLTPVKVKIDAQLLVGRTAAGVNYVFVYLGVDLPTGIPLFSTGASIFGFAGLVAVNLRPDRRGDESWWHGWYQRAPRGVLEPRRKWRVEQGAFAVGLGTTIGTATDDGFAVNVKVLLVLALPGPVIFLQGKGSFVTQRADSQSPDSTGQFESLVVLDVPGKLFSANLAAAYEKKKLLTLRGEAEAAFSWARVPPPDLWHLFVGERTPPEKRVRGVLLDLVNIDSYFQLRGTGIALGGRIGFDGDWRFGPVHAWAHASLSADVAVSWKPPQFAGRLSVHGDAGVEAFGAKVAIILDGSVAAGGGQPWYLALALHLEIVVDLWLIKLHWSADLPLEWGDRNLPLPAPATPVVAAIGARHPKVAEDVGVLDGATLPPDGRPVVVFNRPVSDPGMVGSPTTARQPADIVGPRAFSYRLGHVVLAAGSGASRQLIGAAGVLDVTGGEVRLPAGLSLPPVAGATLELLPGRATFPVTGRTPTGLSLARTPPEGTYGYRLRAAPARAAVQVTAVHPGLLGTAELTLAAAPSMPGGTFAGGVLTLGGTTWTVLAVHGTTVTVDVGSTPPTIGAAALTGPPPPEVQGRWLPTEDRAEAGDPGPATMLMLWARTPYTWFRGSDTETYDGFDAHNPDYACGPAPAEEPICVGFDELSAGPLTGAFRVERLTGDTTGEVQAAGSTPGRWLEIGRTTTGQPGHGVVEISFDPPVDRVLVRCWTGEYGTVSLLRSGNVLASVPVSPKLEVLRLTGAADTIRIEGTLVTVDRVCFTPGWTCVPYEENSFPQDSSGRQGYAGLTLFSPAPMHVTGGVLRVDPVTFIWPMPGILPPVPVTLALLSVQLPQPVTRIRFRVTADCLVWISGNGQEVARVTATAGQEISVAAVTGIIDHALVFSPTRVGATGPCFDAGPFGWRRQEQWSWQQSMRSVTESLRQDDPVLAPGPYTVSVLTGVEITGSGPGSSWDPQRDATFSVGVPPGLTVGGGAQPGQRYPDGGALADLTPYVATSVPAADDRAVYRSYDVGVAFTETYVSRMFLAAGAALTVTVTDANAVDRRAGAPNLWGRGPQVRLAEQDRRFIKNLHGDGTRRCATVDLATVARNETLGTGAGELLAPAAQHVAELRAVGHDRAAYRFAFTTSRFADFRHHLALAAARARPMAAAGPVTVDLTALGAAESALAAALNDYLGARTAITGTPTAAELDAYPAAEQRVRLRRTELAAARAAAFGALWSSVATDPPQPLLPDGVEVTQLTGLPRGGLLLESAEPLRWERIQIRDLAVAAVGPSRTRILSTAHVGSPDRGRFRWAGLEAHTDVELRLHLGVLCARQDEPWTMTLDTGSASRIQLWVTVAAGGTATLTGAGTAAVTGPTGTPVALEVSGAPLGTVTLTGTLVSVLEGQVDEPFTAGPASGSLRVASAALPATAGTSQHHVDIAAYADVDLAGHRLTWTDALQPAAGGDYHVFPAGTSLRDGRTARVYGGLATAPLDRGVDLHTGGTVGSPPPTGVIFRLVAPDGRVLHEHGELPDSAYGAALPVRVLANSDQTRAFLLTAQPFPAGYCRLRLRWLRDSMEELPALSVGGNTDPENAALQFRLV